MKKSIINYRTPAAQRSADNEPTPDTPEQGGQDTQAPEADTLQPEPKKVQAPSAKSNFTGFETSQSVGDFQG